MKITEDINSFLQNTKYLDYNHPAIKEIALKLTKHYNTDRQKARTIFYWVKENIKFEFGYWGIKASKVLKKRKGMCTNKANLLIALLRVLNIPAGYGILKVNTKRFYQELMCPSFRKLVSPKTTHIYVGIFLKGRWIRCDPSVDSELARALKKKTPFAEMTGFNITDKEIKNIKGILKRTEFFANIDNYLDKPPRHAKGITLKILNSYLKFLREKKQKIKNLSTNKQIENNFLIWLSKKNIYYFNFLKKILS